jgi:signal peptidase II
MVKVNRLQVNRRDFVFAAVVLLVIIVDQLSKLWINGRLQPGETLWDIGFLRIIHVLNTGAAFGIFKNATTILIIVDFIGIALILFLVFGMRRQWPFIDKMFIRVSIGLLLGGTIGNLIDRMRFGQVTDFIDFKIWPVWNVADASVTVGVIILAYCLIFMADKAQIKA